MSNSARSFVGVSCLLLCLGLCGLIEMVVIPRTEASAKSRPSNATPAQTCNYSITPTNANIGAAGGSGQVVVTTTPGCAWTATEFSVNSAVELPRVFLNTTYVPSGRPPTMVGPDDNLQAAINAAQPGDVIMLEAGATYIQVLTLPNKPGSDYITIRTSAPDSALPPPGTRITPSYANVMPKMVSPGSEPTLQALNNAHHYRFIGIEFGLAPFAQRVFNLIELGAAQTSEAQLPNNLIFDRVYIHGRPNATIRRGIALNSASTAIIDSYISDCHEIGADSQAIGGWNGSGPYKIVNNYLEGAGENVLFGGNDPTIPNLVPSDIEFRRNHCFKPLTWRVGEPTFGGIPWTVKNLFELKSAQRVLIDGNLFEQNWQDAQNGYSILFTVRNQDGMAPWSVVQDITFTNNIVRRVAGVFNTIGQDTNFPSQISGRFKIANNLFEDVNSARWGGTGTFLQIGATRDVWVDHNTIFQSSNIVFAGGGPSARFLMSNNIAPHNTFGIVGDGSGPGFSTINVYFSDGVIKKNVMAGADPIFYPPFNFFPATLSEVGFVDLAGGNYRLSPASPFKNAGVDGKDLGCDFDRLMAAFGGNPLNQTQGAAPSNSPAVTASPWVIISSNNTGVGSGVVGYSVYPNNGPERTSSVTIAGQTFTVTQANGCTYPLSPGSQFVEAGGGNNTIELTTVAGCAWTAASNNSWITITSGASGTGSGMIGYSVAPNIGPFRSGTLTIGGGTFTVNQQSGCVYTINPTSQTFPALGGNGTVAVTTTSICTWTASNDDPWLRVTGGAPGSGNGAITFSVEVNTETTPRTGRLIIAEQIFTVTQAAGSGGLQYYPLPRPIRLLDTRPGATACVNPGAPLAGAFPYNQMARVACDGVTIPANAQAVVGNATVVNIVPNSAGGFVTLYPGGAQLPTVSNLNYTPGQIVPNAFTVGLGSDGSFNIFPSTTTHMIVDLAGYFAPRDTPGLYYHPLPRPIRLLDTRPGETACEAPAAPLQAGTPKTQNAQLTCSGMTIPANAKALVGNATAVNILSGSTAGFVTLWPDGADQPTVSNLNYLSNQVIPNAFTVGLGQSGAFKIFATSSTHFIVDVTGYYSPNPQRDTNDAAGLLYLPLANPIRLLDTRPGVTACTTPGVPLQSGASLTQNAHVTCNGVTIPNTAQAVVGNGTVVNFISGGGFITLFPTGATQPTVSNLNYLSNQIIPNAFTVGLNANGRFSIFASSSTHFIADLTGYFAP